MGPDRNKHLRNVAIILLLAVVVWQVPGGGTAADTISNLFSILFLGGLLFLGYRLYVQNRETIYGLDEKMRAVLYGSIALIAITLVATERMWNGGGLWAVLWLGFIGAAVYGLVTVWRSYRMY